MDPFTSPALSVAGPSEAAVSQLASRARTLKSTAEIDRTAKEFERMALAQMLALMGQDADISDTEFGGGAGERAFRPFLIEEYAKGFAERGGVGIADAVRREMLRMQEAAGG